MDLLALLAGKGKPKGGDDKGGMGMGKGPSRPGEEFVREMFSALKDDDEQGFVEAFYGAQEACGGGEPDEDDQSEGSGEYQDEG